MRKDEERVRKEAIMSTERIRRQESITLGEKKT